jgi:nanoRNase/pAp phosphatase (c-di-AMP/oligoRNAs hydrolase)
MPSSSLKSLDNLVELASANAGTNVPAEHTVTRATPGAASVQVRSPEQRAEGLRQTLERHQGDRQLVILQDFPDPDALSSAWVYKLIAEQFDIQCDIVYAGTLSHQENIALVKLTGLPVQRWTCPTNRSKERDFSIYQGCALIDNQGTTSQLMELVKQAEIPTTVVIDHHSLQEGLQAEFVDIRLNTRATATIITQYLQAGLLTLDSSVSDHVKCATALMHGLRSDTNRLMQAQEEDFLAAAYLSRFYDSQLLNTVLQSSRSKQVMDVIERALKNRSVFNNVTIAGVGYLRYDDRESPRQQTFSLLRTMYILLLSTALSTMKMKSWNWLSAPCGQLKLPLIPMNLSKRRLAKMPKGASLAVGAP